MNTHGKSTDKISKVSIHRYGLINDLLLLNFCHRGMMSFQTWQHFDIRTEFKVNASLKTMTYDRINTEWFLFHDQASARKPYPVGADRGSTHKCSPVLINRHRPWCNPCREARHRTFSRESIRPIHHSASLALSIAIAIDSARRCSPMIDIDNWYWA